MVKGGLGVGRSCSGGVTPHLARVIDADRACMRGSIDTYLMVVSRVAQAWATLRSGEVLPGNVAQPPFSI